MSNPAYTEIEAKFYISDLARLETRLVAQGAELVRARVLEHNLRFDTEGDKLSQARQLLRLRKDEEARITYKGPSEVEGGVVNREEIEVVVSDYEAAKKMLEALGYQVVVIYEKYRATYKLDGQLWMLDELPFVDFVEIEGRAAEEIRASAQALELNWDRRVNHGYLYLFERVKDALGLGFRDLTFANFVEVAVRAQDLGVLAGDDKW
ncbi:MAG: class IV adenylate cyclase [Chloroflexi bacterium]|nr:class IV adenylate cyclase [Chloroflexota bacterium]